MKINKFNLKHIVFGISLALFSGILITSGFGIQHSYAQTVDTTLLDDCPKWDKTFSFAQPGPDYIINSPSMSTSMSWDLTTPSRTTSGGIPGVIEFCVYPNIGVHGPDISHASSESTTGVGADAEAWTSGTDCSGGCLDAIRPHGDPSNIPADGTTTSPILTVGFTSAPTNDTVVLHVNDPDYCTALFGQPTTTCFIIPKVSSGNNDLIVSKTATPSFTRTYDWNILKSVDNTQLNVSGGTATFNYQVNATHDSGTDSGWKVTGNIKLNNTNTFAITTDVTDAVDNGGTCIVSGGTGVTVPAASVVTLPYTCTYSSVPSPLSGTNTATATWDNTQFKTPNSSGTGKATFDFTSVSPTIVDGSVIVKDSLGGTLGTATYTQTNPIAFTYSQSFTDPAGTCTTHDNTANFTTSDTQNTGKDSKTVKVCVGTDLKVSKTATPYFTRNYTWNILKSVDKPLVKQLGGTTTFTYTVKVNETGFIDSKWIVNGTITVSNPNDWEDITANITDVVNNGGTCTVNGGTSVTIPKSSSMDFKYSCTYASAPSPLSGTNNATATWDNTAFFTTDGSASGTATFDFTNLSPSYTNNKTIHVTDSFNGPLGTVTATDSQPFVNVKFTYQRTVPIPQYSCTIYNNIASITETGQTSSQKIKVYGPAHTGAYAMISWQGTKGQGIISNGASTAGVCKSGTWLRQYAPFQDLSSTATCSQVATYVSNVIKAANNTGTSVNPMLKAQMLTTSLDVYFSDPALGGNMIGAPVHIGGATIDLSKICKMTDSTSGTSTCSGTFVNVGNAFGGAHSLTVSQLLSFASTKSNVGGSVWYAQVKTTQGLAKDTFDSINNQVAFNP